MVGYLKSISEKKKKKWFLLTKKKKKKKNKNQIPENNENVDKIEN